MAKQPVQKDYSDTEKLRHYSEVLSDPNSTNRQISWAKRRVSQLTQKLTGQKQPTRQTRQTVSTLPATPQQENAFSAGLGYGAAQSGARVPVKPENKPAFRNGVKVGRALRNNH